MFLALRLKMKLQEHGSDFGLEHSYLGLRPRGRSYDGERIPNNSAGVQISFRVPPADVDLGL